MTQIAQVIGGQKMGCAPLTMRPSRAKLILVGGTIRVVQVGHTRASLTFARTVVPERNPQESQGDSRRRIIFSCKSATGRQDQSIGHSKRR